jgi:hypothetical protein
MYTMSVKLKVNIHWQNYIQIYVKYLAIVSEAVGFVFSLRNWLFYDPESRAAESSGRAV